MTGANAKAKVTYIAQYAGAQDSSESAWNNVKNMVTNTVQYLTFDGGILKTGQAGEFFQSADGSRVPDRVLVYEKGATIDTDGKDVTWRAPLARPEGKGLASVSINKVHRGGLHGEDRQDLWKHEGGGHIHHAARLPAVPYARGQRRR